MLLAAHSLVTNSSAKQSGYPPIPRTVWALESKIPSGKILENYNKKRDKALNPLDPPMPCIVVEEPCPCWTYAELESINGYAPDGELLPVTYNDSGQLPPGNVVVLAAFSREGSGGS